MNRVVTMLLGCFLPVCGLPLAVATGAQPGLELRVGTYDNPPKIFTTDEGQTTGIFPEVLNAIAAERGWKIVYVHGSWPDCLERLRKGEIDLMPDMAASEEREMEFLFSREPVLVNWGIAYARSDLPVSSFLDMAGRSVAVMQGSIHTEGDQGIKKLLSKFGVECNLVEVESYRDVFMLVDAKLADIGIVNRLFGTMYGDEFDVTPTPIIFNPSMLAFGAPRDSRSGAEWLRQIDESLARLKDQPDSIYHRVLAYYLGGGGHEWQATRGSMRRDLKLPEDEAAWVRENPRVRIAVDPGFAPFEFIDRQGNYGGMAADYLKLLARKTGLEFELVQHSTWSESIEALKRGEIDMLPCVGIGAERKEFLSFTEPYLKFARVIVTAVDKDVQSMDDLPGLRVGVQRNSSHHAFLNEQSDVDPVFFDTFEEVLLAVSRGDVDAALGNLAVTTYFMRELALTNIKLAAYASDEPQVLSIGVRKDLTNLVNVLNRALGDVTEKQRNAVLAKWLPLPMAAPGHLDLSQEEREWLLMHPRIRVVWHRDLAPFEFADSDGHPQGIAIDYLRAVEELLGIRFEMDPTENWEESLARLRGHDADMSACLAITAGGLDQFSFTDAYVSTPVVIFGKGDMPYIRSLTELDGRTVAVVRGYVTDEWVTRDFPDLRLVRAESLTHGFELLRTGDVDTFVGGVIPGNFYLSRFPRHDIKIVGETPYSFQYRMAVRKDWPVFAGILQKALDALPEEDRTAFYRKWVWVKYEHGRDYALLFKVLAAGLAVILVFGCWNLRLAAEVRRRRKAEDALSRSQDQLSESYANLKKMEELKDNLTHMIVHDMRSPLTGIRGSLEMIEQVMDPASLDPSVRECLHLADHSAQDLLKMVQALLDISRFESHEMPVNRVMVDVRKVAKLAIQSLAGGARLMGQEIVLGGEPVTASVDPEIVKRILVNLITNAMKASPENARIDVDVAARGDRLVVEVRDRGRGIPREAQHLIFDKFACIDGKDKRDSASIGLGLAFCKLAVEAHEGAITVESEVGRGSTFRVELPLSADGVTR